MRQSLHAHVLGGSLQDCRTAPAAPRVGCGRVPRPSPAGQSVPAPSACPPDAAPKGTRTPTCEHVCSGRMRRSAIAAQAIWERDTRRMSSCLRRAQYAAYATNVNAELPAQQTQATDPPVSSRPHGVIRRERVCSSPVPPVPRPRFTHGLVLKRRWRPARRYGILAAQLVAKGPFRDHVTRNCTATSSSNLDAETGPIPVLGVGSPFLETQGRTESGAEGVTPGGAVTQNSREDGAR